MSWKGSLVLKDQKEILHFNDIYYIFSNYKSSKYSFEKQHDFLIVIVHIPTSYVTSWDSDSIALR